MSGTPQNGRIRERGLIKRRLKPGAIRANSIVTPRSGGDRGYAHVATGRMLAMKPVGKTDAGNPHVRFDERGGETGRASDTAPFLDSTIAHTEPFGQRRHGRQDADDDRWLCPPSQSQDKAGVAIPDHDGQFQHINREIMPLQVTGQPGQFG